VILLALTRLLERNHSDADDIYFAGHGHFSLEQTFEEAEAVVDASAAVGLTPSQVSTLYTEALGWAGERVRGIT
jgi:hypothetical protein